MKNFSFFGAFFIPIFLSRRSYIYFLAHPLHSREQKESTGAQLEFLKKNSGLWLFPILSIYLNRREEDQILKKFYLFHEMENLIIFNDVFEREAAGLRTFVN